MDPLPSDASAEGVARFIQRRSDVGSYHDIVDSDSGIHLVRYTCEAFHDGTGSNPHSYGLSFACRAADWSTMSSTRRRAYIENGAKFASIYATWVKSTYNITIPSARITRPQSDRRIAGFISHAQRDPQRRTDPGQDFPWAEFLIRFRQLMTVPPKPPMPPTLPTVEDQMFTLFYVEESKTYYSMTPWAVNELTVAEGFAIDSDSTGLTAVVIPTKAAWAKIRKNAPA